MSQLSPKRPVSFSLIDTEDVGIDCDILCKPPTGPQRTIYKGTLISDNCNLGELCVKVAQKHVISASGLPHGNFDKRSPDALDDWEPEWIMSVAMFVIEGCQLSEPQAGNSE